MEITAKSIYHSNIVFVFEKNNFITPDNAAIISSFGGTAASGAHFADDVVLKTKILDLPQLKLQIIIEPSRLRIEDNSQLEPEESILIKEAISFYQKNFSQNKLAGFGFNFDIYYRTDKAIHINDLLLNFAKEEMLEKKELRDLGFQFTLEEDVGRKRAQYLIKVTAPLELAVHVNCHYSENKIPEQNKLQELFTDSYDKIDEIIRNLNI